MNNSLHNTLAPVVQYELIANSSKLSEILSPLMKARVIAIDTETTGLDPIRDRIRLLQIAVPQSQVIIVDLAALTDSELSPLKALLNSSALKVFQNGKFDWQVLEMAGLRPSGPFFDVMLASQVLRSGLKKDHDLQSLTFEFLGIKLDKSLQSSNFAGKLSASQLEYAALDAAVLLKLRVRLHSKLRSAGLLETAQIEFAAMPAVAQMELNGMLLDAEQWQLVGDELKAQKQATLVELVKAGLKPAPSAQLSLFPDMVETINPRSSVQVLSALQALKIPIKSTSKSELIPIARQYPVIQLLLNYRKLASLCSNFAEALPKHIHPITGRIHPSYRQCGARSGRFSCKQPNLQNVPRNCTAKGMRACFIATPGYHIIKADYSQIELRIVAEISGDAKMLDAYAKGEDLHTLTASLITGKVLEEVTSEDRRIAKSVNFGLIYGMGAAKLQAYAEEKYDVLLTLEEAKEFRKRFFQAYSGVRRWHDSIRRTVYVKDIKQIRTIGGRRRRWAKKPRLSELLNHPVQGTSADMLKVAIVRLFKLLPKTGAKLIGVVHDEILLECPKATLKRTSCILKKVMVEAGELYLQQVPVEVEVTICSSWA
ncbi:bifunctional 3'-5' exonuclease/DNA polymerase [Kamptonema sp. UHCC 0994]|uniref:bifunctional 3'-5' exonuclease/DNA polymerase n=1 Tax=Kamptonema sp. UHCC 0994 TaxID=3031329 RepID=UPI0023B8DDA0|nr:bifunctional 3'-5' exonuclease/DNA polymerase [Kamptonema sp. UHCC 0994]MDF0554030.1 bifunctional 3'-5' exonuclease/DNA polymerase [Kamptonema sp. UHCC 0994]